MSALRWRDQRIGPEPDQPHAALVVRIERLRPVPVAAHLHGKPHDLRHQDSQQHQQVPIADEEGFHESQGVRGQWLREV